MKIKKIAFVYDAIYPYVKGGGERRYYELAKRLSVKGHEVHLYGMKFWKGSNVIKKDGIYLHGICPAMPLYTKDGKRSIWQAIYFGINCLKLMKEDFDIIDCCGFPYFSLFACKLVCLLKHKKLNSTWHEVWGKEYWKAYLGNLWLFGYLVEGLAVKMPDKIIAGAPSATLKIKNDLKYHGSIVTIYSGVNLEEIEVVKPARFKSDIIYAGRLMDFKHIDLLIKSVAILKEKKPDVMCLIIGDGPEKKGLESMTISLNLKKNVWFLGFLKNHDEVYSYMKSSKVFALPSTREGFGIVALEANACGIPVITVKHKDNGSKDLIEEETNGFICLLDEEEIAKKLTRILKNNLSEKMKKACVDSASKYKWDAIANRIEEVYLK